MNWIKVAVNIGRDSSVGNLRDRIGVSLPTTCGHYLLVLTAMAEGCVDGDLSTITDTQIERWAEWKGARGKFAQAMRAELCTPQGVMRSWDKYNGSKLRELDSDRERKKAARDAAKSARMSGGRPADEAQTSPGRPPLRDVTLRDVRNNNNKQLSRPAVAAGPKAKFPHFPVGLCQSAYDVWLAEVGSTPFPAFRKAFGPLFQRPECERPATLPRDAELIPAVKLYLAAVAGTNEARFTTPQRCAGSLARVIEALREGKDSDARLSGAQWAIGTGQRPLFKGAA